MTARALAGLLALALADAALPVIRILPLGDSITFGCGSDAAPPNWYACCTPSSGGYRMPLWAALNESAINATIQMVGTESNGPEFMPISQRAHEGHPGWVINQIATLQSKWVALTPDVVLLMAGTNDVGQKHANATIVADMAKLLASLRATLPAARILVTSILSIYSSDNPDLPASVDAYNAALPALVAAAGANFFYVPVAENTTGVCGTDKTTWSIGDGVHPNAAGHARVASVFSLGMRRVLCPRFETDRAC